MHSLKLLIFILVLALVSACEGPNEKKVEIKSPSAADILGNEAYPAISYGGYRDTARTIQPTISQLKEDMKILAAMGIKLLRTYNVQLPQAGNLLAAIRELKTEDPAFEMYVMLGAWIDCKNAWTGLPVDHNVESEKNAGEIDRVVQFAKEHPDIVKIIAVGNEAMVKWAAAYYVQPGIILKWVDHLQGLKKSGELPADLWITSSDNFASWGGGGGEYHVADLEKLIRSVDYISLHTYPMHDTHYNPAFWGVETEEEKLDEEEQIEAAMRRALKYAQGQYRAVVDYVDSLGIEKPIHIGETGWASSSNSLYGASGSRACDEYKEGLYHEYVREWTKKENISCFYFEAFDEPWKDARNPGGSENFFGLFTVDGQAKYAIWPLVDQGVFDGLTRDGNAITKTYQGDKAALMKNVLVPAEREELTH